MANISNCVPHLSTNAKPRPETALTPSVCLLDPDGRLWGFDAMTQIGYSSETLD
jgi:hypothetical protein